MKKILTIIFILISINSCRVTKSMWEDSYEENISNFLISTDAKYVAFLGSKYDYIFNDYSGEVRNTFFWQNSTILRVDPSRSHFAVNANNEIDATIAIKSARVGVSQEDMAYLRSLGFQDKGDGMIGKIKLHGRRYLANKENDKYAGYYTLTSPYKIKVTYVGVSGRSAALTVRNVVLTPITATLDTVLLFGRVLSEED